MANNELIDLTKSEIQLLKDKIKLEHESFKLSKIEKVNKEVSIKKLEELSKKVENNVASQKEINLLQKTTLRLANSRNDDLQKYNLSSKNLLKQKQSIEQQELQSQIKNLKDNQSYDKDMKKLKLEQFQKQMKESKGKGIGSSLMDSFGLGGFKGGIGGILSGIGLGSLGGDITAKKDKNDELKAELVEQYDKNYTELEGIKEELRGLRTDNMLIYDKESEERKDQREKITFSKSPDIPSIKGDGKAPKEKKDLGLGALGMALIGGGITALIAGLKSGGPFKGLMKLVGKIFLGIGGKLLSKAIPNFIKKFAKFIFGGLGKLVGGKIAGKFAKIGLGKIMGPILKWIGKFAKILKKIPFLGTLIGIAFGVSRIMKGDVAGGIIEFLGALSGLLNLVVPGLGTALQWGFDILLAFLDFKGITGKNGSMNKPDFWKGVWKWIKGKFTAIVGFLEEMPIIGDLIKGVKAIAKGDFLTGLKHLAMVINPLGPILSVVSWAKKTPFGKSVIKKTGNFFGKLWNWVKGKVSALGDFIYNMPVVGDLIRGVQKIMSGDFTGGISELAKAIPMFGFISSLFGKAEGIVVEDTKKEKSGGKSFFSIIKDKILGFKDKLTSVVMGWFAPLFQALPSWAKKGLRVVLPKELAKTLLSEPEEETIQNVTSPSQTSPQSAPSPAVSTIARARPQSIPQSSLVEKEQMVQANQNQQQMLADLRQKQQQEQLRAMQQTTESAIINNNNNVNNNVNNTTTVINQNKMM